MIFRGGHKGPRLAIKCRLSSEQWYFDYSFYIAQRRLIRTVGLLITTHSSGNVLWRSRHQGSEQLEHSLSFKILICKFIFFV